MNNHWNDSQTQDDKHVQAELLASGTLPHHIAIIMDGNGRWAMDRKLPRVAGHKQGIESVRDIVKACSQLHIEFLTVYAFSMENWKRPRMEVQILMTLLKTYLQQEIDELDANNVRLQAIGKLNALPKHVQSTLNEAIARTAHNTGLTLTLALSYSSRWDIVRAVQMMALDIRRGTLSPEDITDEQFSQYLLTKDMPDPDLVIRTSGEMRLSNFLLWESAYAEMYITKQLWPDFRREDLYLALRDFLNRERRFGKTGQQLRESETNDNDQNSLRKIMSTFSSRS